MNKEGLKKVSLTILKGLGVVTFVYVFAMFALAIYAKPKEVMVTNITSNSATITWYTDLPMQGVVSVKDSNKFLPGFLAWFGSKEGYDDRDVADSQTKCVDKYNKKIKPDATFTVDTDSFDCYSTKVTRKGRYYMHHVTVSDLNENTKYYFRAGDGWWKWKSKIVGFTTYAAAQSVKEPQPMFGKVKTTGGAEATDSVVFVTFRKNSEDRYSGVYSSVVNQQGGWYIDGGNIREASTGDILPLVSGDESVNVQAKYRNKGVSDIYAWVFGEFDAAYPDILVPEMRVDSKSGSLIGSAFAALTMDDGTELPGTPKDFKKPDPTIGGSGNTGGGGGPATPPVAENFEEEDLPVIENLQPPVTSECSYSSLAGCSIEELAANAEDWGYGRVAKEIARQSKNKLTSEHLGMMGLCSDNNPAQCNANACAIAPQSCIPSSQINSIDDINLSINENNTWEKREIPNDIEESPFLLNETTSAQFAQLMREYDYNGGNIQQDFTFTTVEEVVPVDIPMIEINEIPNLVAENDNGLSNYKIAFDLLIGNEHIYTNSETFKSYLEFFKNLFDSVSKPPSSNIVNKAYADNKIESNALVFLPEYGQFSVQIDGIEVTKETGGDNKVLLFYLDVNGKKGFQPPKDIKNPTAQEDILITSKQFKVQLEQEATTRKYDLKSGINIISFDFMPVATEGVSFTAKNLINLAQKSNIRIEYVSYFEGGRWVEGVKCEVEGECLGNDFVLVPGKGYVVKVTESGKLSVPAYNLKTPVPVSLSTGWNLVGVHGYPKLYTAKSLLTSVNAIQGLGADNVTWYPISKGRYEGLQMVDGIEYGFDFPISPTFGYFIRVANFSPTNDNCRSLIWHDGGELHGQCSDTQ